MHTQSESHVRQMVIVGEDPKKVINDFSRQFQRDFLQLLKTGHGEKQVNINHFYQEYIANKEHVHMNATKWPSLTEFAKYLGREGICRVEENEKGIHVSWIDDSPDAMRRREAVRRKENQDKGDEEREQRMIREQIKRAQKEAARKDDELDDEERELRRGEGEKIKLAFGTKPVVQADAKSINQPKSESPAQDKVVTKPGATTEAQSEPIGAPVSLKIGAAKPQTKNVFAAAKKNALSGGTKKPNPFQQEKKMSEAERIMKEEMEQNKKRSNSGFGGFSLNKKQRTN